MFSATTHVTIRRRAQRAALGTGVVLGLAGGCERAAPVPHDAAAARSATPAGVTLVDDDADTVRIATTPTRIVSLNPTTTEILFALGAGGRLVGRTHWDVYPESARTVPDLGNAFPPNVEAVLATRPDLVVVYASASNRKAADAIRAAGVPVLALRIDRADQFARSVHTLAAAVGSAARGDTIVDTVTATLARVRAATASLPHPRVVWPLLGTPLYVAGAGSFLSELVDAAGATNVFADLPQPAPQASREEVLRRGADVIVVGPRGAAELKADAAWRGLAAVRTGHVVVVDTALFLRPSIQLGMAAAQLAERLHPGALSRAAPASPR